MRRQSVARLMPGSLAAAFFSLPCAAAFRMEALRRSIASLSPVMPGKRLPQGCSGRASTLRARVRANPDTRLISSPSQPS